MSSFVLACVRLLLPTALLQAPSADAINRHSSLTWSLGLHFNCVILFPAFSFFACSTPAMTGNPSFSDATLELLALRERRTTLSQLRDWLAAPWRFVCYELASRKARLLQSRLCSLSQQEFELLLAEAFGRVGYRPLENTGDASVVGVDLILDRDGQKFFVQCKQWKVLKAEVKAIRELFDVMNANGVRDGFFVSAGSYTSEARAFADEVGISLVDGVGLGKLMKAR